ncbi:MAG: hypothetical protein O0V67_03790 [Methanocorpusculum sp.]|nr:hypothetical protein [Methanocorpusculum sp.]
MRKEIDSMIKKGVEEILKSDENDKLIKISRDSQIIAATSAVIAIVSLWFTSYDPLKEICPDLFPCGFVILTALILIASLVILVYFGRLGNQ